MQNTCGFIEKRTNSLQVIYISLHVWGIFQARIPCCSTVNSILSYLHSNYNVFKPQVNGYRTVK